MTENTVSNKEILQILKSMQDKSESIIVLTPSEIQTFRDILKTITVDDLRYIKEYSEDRKAVSRVFGKAKNFLLVVASVVAAYFLILRNVLPPLREMLIRFLQSGGTPGG